MTPLRILVVDDAVVVRRIVTDALSEDPEIEVVGVAANGRIALTKIAQLKPDLVTLDVEMPEMDGLETISEIRKQWPRLPVIMFSTLTERGANVTIEALSRGASDYVTKPANVGSVVTARQRVRDELLPKVFALCGRKRAAKASVPAPAPVVAVRPKPPVRPPGALNLRPGIVVVGVSTGGPNALVELVSHLPRNLPVPLLIVQHMPPLFTRFLAERLTKLGTVPFTEAKAGDVLRPGAGWIAPGDWHMVVRPPAQSGQPATLDLNQFPPEHSCRPAVDPLFRSAAEVFGARTLGVVLTGMGHDGVRGAEAIVRAGGHVLAQDEATSVVWGMPGFVTNAGLADQVLPIEHVAPEIARRVSDNIVRHASYAVAAPSHA